MSIFKNTNETAYVGNRKHWTDVIKNSGSGDLLIWRQPEEDFNTNSTLIVMPGEEAIFIKGGVIEQIFDKSGTYKLATENYPFISRFKNAFSGGVSTFNCVVYFVRKANSKEILWGTESPIQVRDNFWQIRTDAKVRGAYKVRIENSEQFLKKLLGNNIPLLYQTELEHYFANEFQGKIKTVVSKFLNNSLEQELIGIDAYIDDLSRKIKPSIDNIVSEYGLRCIEFSLSAIDIDISKYDALDESLIALVERQRGFQSDKAGLDILGNDWERVQIANISKDLANNTGAGGMAANGAGIAMGLVAAEAVRSIAQNKGGSGCIGNNGDPVEILSKLKKMLNVGLITQTEYDKKKDEILRRM